MIRSLALACAVLVAGCGPVRVLTVADVPTPLLTKMPMTVALFLSPDFSAYVHKEERGTSDWEISIGQAQKDTLVRLLDSMFDRVVQVDSLAAGAQLGPQVQAILEPSIEEYAFVTPRDAGSEFFAVSIKYRVNVYSADGKLADSWGFTGYGTAPAGGLSHTEPLARATALAMRDAGAKLAVEFREQAVIRELLPGAQTPDGVPASDTPAAVAPEASGTAPTEPAVATEAAPAVAGDTPGQEIAPPAESIPEEEPGTPEEPPAEEPAQPAEPPSPQLQPFAQIH